MFVAIDRTSKLVFVELHECATPGNKASAAPRSRLLTTVENALKRVLSSWLARSDIDHQLKKPNLPWTNRQAGRMNRTLKEATVRRYYYESHEKLRNHLLAFVDAYNYAKRLKALKGLTPFEHIMKYWMEEPDRVRINPSHHSPGLNI